MSKREAVYGDLSAPSSSGVSCPCGRVAKASEGPLAAPERYLVVEGVLCERVGTIVVPLGRVETLLEAVFGGRNE